MGRGLVPRSAYRCFMQDDPFAFEPIRYPSALTSINGFECIIDHRGQPHDVSFSNVRQPASLKIEYAHDDEAIYGAGQRATGVIDIAIGKPYAKAGWKLRRDYFREWYASESSKKKKEHIVACWKKWLDFYSRCHDERRPSVARKTFPDKYLPPAEVKLRNDWAKTQKAGEWDPEETVASA